MEWLKSLWSRWKIQVSVVGGVLVVATAYGTCSVDPAAVSNNDTTNTTEITETTSETVEVSATTEVAEKETNTGDTTTTETTTTETTTE